MYFYNLIVIFKRLHILLIKSFLPPFIVTLFTSVFLFFLVQIVITYLDDMIGKGLRTIDLLQLFFYAWVAIVPQCIPLAVLLGSIMCFGKLAENYELAAMKSSGLSLFRIMRPLILVIFVLAGLTFLFNNFVLPFVNLKSHSLLHDIRQKKPTVNIKEGVFYNGIENYSIRVGRKSENKDSLKDVYIYNHTAHMGNTIQMYAKNGRITTTADTSDLILILMDGNRYTEERANQYDNSTKRTLTHLSFRTLQVNIPLEDFKLKRTNEELFRGNEVMLNVWQLDSVADSTRRILKRRVTTLQNQSSSFFYSRMAALEKSQKKYPLVYVSAFCDSLDKEKKSQLVQNALNIARAANGNIDSAEHGIKREEDAIMKYNIEWHKKIVVCFACIILFFIGASLGAIIKKGGLGLPVVVSVIFFLAYYILTEMYLNLAYEAELPVWQALWTPLAIFFPISVFLTYKAANDSVIFDATIYYSWMNKLFKKKSIA